MARHPGAMCTVPEHQDGEHDASCCPPADPGNPELRLLRAIFGLCPICDVEAPHGHTDAEYEAASMLPPRPSAETGQETGDTS